MSAVARSTPPKPLTWRSTKPATARPARPGGSTPTASTVPSADTVTSPATRCAPTSAAATPSRRRPAVPGPCESTPALCQPSSRPGARPAGNTRRSSDLCVRPARLRQNHAMTDTTRPADVAADDLVAAARALGPLIEAERPRMEAERQLTGPVVAALQELGAFRMAVPRELGGPELDPMTQVRIVEELSRLDGSVGWCVMIAAAASYVPGFLAPDAARRWFGPPDACLAGQLAPTG